MPTILKKSAKVKPQQLRFAGKSLFPNVVTVNGRNNASLQEHKDFQPAYLFKNPKFGGLGSAEGPAKNVEAPYCGTISAGKNTYVYDAHTYHTKVPPEGIESLIEYYTPEGGVVLDLFCGSGMTGIAAGRKGRNALLSDLSPAAAFIAYNLNTPLDADRYWRAVTTLLEQGRELEAELYQTKCRECGQAALMLYTVWSYGVKCTHCDEEIILWDVVRDERPRVRDSKIKSEFDCPHCGKHLQKRTLSRTKRFPVQVGYRCCASGLKEQTADLDIADKKRLARIEKKGIPDNLWYPRDEFPKGVNTKQPIAAGITSIDKAYTTRALYAMAFLWNKALEWPVKDEREKLLFTLTSLYQRVTLFSEFRFWGGSSNTANFNVPSIINEQNVFKTFERKARTIKLYFQSAPKRKSKLEVSTQSACDLSQVPDRSVDYIFTDPPFGSNINYSEMNFLWESWLKVRTQIEDEAIVNRVQGKSVEDYSELLKKAFSEARRVLKDEGWMTVVFHNSSEKVWAALQRAINGAGFRIEGTQTFDKKHGTFKQFVSDNAVGYDLVLHCRKSSDSRRLSVASEEKIREAIATFAAKALQSEPEKYVVHYLHVKREPEIDFRKLYAEWISSAIRQEVVTVGFEAFRRIVGESVSQDFQINGKEMLS